MSAVQCLGQRVGAAVERRVQTKKGGPSAAVCCARAGMCAPSTEAMGGRDTAIPDAFASAPVSRVRRSIGIGLSLLKQG